MLSTLPATFDEALAKVITDTLDHWWDKFTEIVTSEGSRRVIEHDLYQHLLASTFDMEVAIDLADAGFAAADAAMRDYLHTYVERGGRLHELSLQVQAFASRAWKRAPLTTYPRGIVDIFTRDIVIRVMAVEAARVFSLGKTRGDATGKPSAAFFIALVLHRRGMKMTEGTVNDIIWGRNKVGERLDAYIVSILRKNSNGDDFPPAM